ncbi:MAG: transglutaminase domain-containing protein [Phycisphaerae bacterium]|nr:transglutaminase domain-containing protein [Phycisphaerae bacterium]
MPSTLRRPRPAPPRWPLVLLAMLLPALAGAPAAPPADQPAAPAAAARPVHTWHVMQMNGKRAGHLHTVELRTPDRIVTESTVRLTIKRGNDAIDLRIEGRTEETPAGAPISMRTLQALGSAPVETLYTFEPDGVRTVTISNGQRSESRQPLPAGAWLTPAAAERAVADALAKGQKTITVRTIDPSLGLRPIVITRTVLERTTAEALGRTVPAVKWSVAVDAFPGVVSTEYVDEQGRPIRAETDLGGIKVVQLLADKDLALGPIDAPELLLSTMVAPTGAMPDPRSISSAVYRLWVADGRMPDVPAGCGQTVERIDDRTLRVTVETGPAAAPDAGHPSEPRPEDCLAATQMLNHADPAVNALLAKAKVEGLGPAARAEALRAFVHQFIRSKDLSVGFASAGEVARTRVGDCTEHAVLLAALLRAAGTPARVVSGLIAVPGPAGKPIFGYHMWTEAHIADTGRPGWLPLDATLPPSARFDATHIRLDASALADDDSVNFMVKFAPLFNRLRIDVEHAK